MSMWFFADLDSRRALDELEALPLTTAQESIVDVIQIVFTAIELVMAVSAFGLAPGLCALFIVTFGPGILSIFAGLAIAPTIWLLLRKPRAVVKSLLLQQIAVRARDEPAFVDVVVVVGGGAGARAAADASGVNETTSTPHARG